MSRSRAEAIALFVTAVLVRGLLPDASFFGMDQVGTLLNGRAVLEGDWFVPGPGIGWSSFSLGPLFNQVAAVALAARDEFADVIVLLAAIHGAAVVGWRSLLAEIAEGPEAARAIRVLGWALALHPVSVSTGSSPISASLVMPTTLLFSWGIARWVRRDSGAGFACACLGAALMVQAHITTVLLLPLFLVGFRRRAAIGRIGAMGVVAALLVACPMIVHNVRMALGQAGGFQHAGAAGASLLVALGRALTLEARTLQIVGDAPGALPILGRLAGAIWAAFEVVGIAVIVRSRTNYLTRSFLVFGLALPTLAVVLIPRGALFYYLDSTVPWRALLFATGGSALMTRRGAPTPRTVASLVVVLGAFALVFPSGLMIAVRVATAERGFSEVNMSRVDLREPVDAPIESFGILTLGSQRALGHALDRLGADPDSLDRTLHGPWRASAAVPAGIWTARSRGVVWHPPDPNSHGSDHDDAASASRDTRGYLVIHRDDPQSAVPAGNPTPAGPFRAYAFEDVLHVQSADSSSIAATIASRGPTVLQVVTDRSHGVGRALAADHALRPIATSSRAGFEVYSIEVPKDAPVVRVELQQDPAFNPLVRAAADAYAFTVANDPSAEAHPP